MPRRKEQSKHPALALRDVTSRSRKEAKEIVGSEEFLALGLEDREFLSYYLLTRDYRKAAELAGKELGWLEEREAEVPGFRRIVQKVLDHPLELAEMMVLEVVPYTMVRLRMLIDQDENKSVQLNAIKHMHALAGLVPGDSSGTPANIFNFNNVSLWGGPSENGRVIDSDTGP